MSSAKFEHILVECFKPFEREDAKSRREIPINGIRKIYSLTTRVNNTTPTAPDIKAKPLTCTSCEANKECDLCKLIPPVDQKGVDFDDIQQVVPMFVDDQDIGLTDDEDQEDALVDENIQGRMRYTTVQLCGENMEGISTLEKLLILMQFLPNIKTNSRLQNTSM